jgi:hypothetical protein
VAVLISCETAGTLVPDGLLAGTDPESNETAVAAPMASEQAASESAASESAASEQAVSEQAVSESAAARVESEPRSVETSSDSVDTSGGRIAREMAAELHMPCVVHAYRRDLIDVTRSLHHRDLFGRQSRHWSDAQKQLLIETVYRPYRQRIEASVERILQHFHYVIHLSVRTFPAKFRAKPRRTDIGLLYDPAREEEMAFCIDWIDEMYDINPNVRVRRNYPRRGTVDSLTKAMRCRFSAEQYLGIDVWMNRAWAARDVRLRDEALLSFCEALRRTLGIPGSVAA